MYDATSINPRSKPHGHRNLNYVPGNTDIAIPLRSLRGLIFVVLSFSLVVVLLEWRRMLYLRISVVRARLWWLVHSRGRHGIE